MRKCTIRLTDSAERYAARHQVEEELAKIELGPESLTGDLVSLETRDRPHDFIITSRRWVVSNESTRLELTLDHPVRRGRP
ncbi:hypothetical protein [Taklimakanibacter deserti]|uniref:hypothetical protein n=1 Tax=Taklimakanibacter deserti TaxID=2267839 RepID=UPI000E64660F